MMILLNRFFTNRQRYAKTCDFQLKSTFFDKNVRFFSRFALVLLKNVYLCEVKKVSGKHCNLPKHFDMKTLSGLDSERFEMLLDGKQTQLTVLKNAHGCEVALLNYGARIVSLLVPDKNGKMVDVVTGHESIADYLTTEEPYFGAICGRYANRIARGHFLLDGKDYNLAINNGPNSLHGGVKGFTFRVWDVEKLSDEMAVFRLTAADGEEGYPGNLQVEVRYTLTDENIVKIDYRAITDKPTVLNLTNHSYFNLSGEGEPTAEDHIVAIHADEFLPMDDTSIPYGKPEKVADSPMDFRTPHVVGERIEADFEQLHFGRGYDHTFIIRKNADEMAVAVECVSPKTGIKLTVASDQPGVQFYSANWMTGNMLGKHGHRYPMRAALCFETQHFPDSPNKPEYPSVVLRPTEIFESHTEFRFSTVK